MDNPLYDLAINSGILALTAWLCMHASRPIFETKSGRITSQAVAGSLLFVSFAISKVTANSDGTAAYGLGGPLLGYLAAKATAMYLIGCYAKSVGKNPYWTFVGLLNFALALPSMAIWLWRDSMPAPLTSTTSLPTSGSYREVQQKVVECVEPQNASISPVHEALQMPEDPYQIAGNEVLSGHVDAGLWARALVEGAGEDGVVKAAYVRYRVAQLQQEAKLKIDEIRKEEAARQKNIADFANSNGVSLDDAATMLPLGIAFTNGYYVVYEIDGVTSYRYESLDDAKAYAQKVIQKQARK